MIGDILLILAGAVAASVVWFFVWRNNKKEFASVLEAIDLTGIPQKIADEIKKLLEKYRK